MRQRDPWRLIDRRALIVVSDPWELVDEEGNNWFEGTISGIRPFSAEVDRETVLIDLAQAVTWKSITYGSVLVGARHGEGLLDALSEADPVDCNLIGITERGREQPDHLHMSAWRGGLSAIVSLRLTG